MASTTSWDETVPSGTSSIAQGDDDIRSLKSFFRSWVSQEHYTTDGSSTSAGEHKLGSARAFQLPLSKISGVANRAGQLSHDTTNNYLWVGSGSSISNVLGAGVNSVNTWTVRQNFTGVVSITGGLIITGLLGNGFGDVSSYTTTLAQVVLAPTSSATRNIANPSASLNTKTSVQISLMHDAGVPIICSTHHDLAGNAVFLTLYNPSASTYTIVAQTINVSVLSMLM